MKYYHTSYNEIVGLCYYLVYEFVDMKTGLHGEERYLVGSKSKESMGKLVTRQCSAIVAASYNSATPCYYELTILNEDGSDFGKVNISEVLHQGTVSSFIRKFLKFDVNDTYSNYWTSTLRDGKRVEVCNFIDEENFGELVKTVYYKLEFKIK